MPEPLGIFGGTFDPVHFGHLRLAEEACTALGLAQVLWIPAGQPPHRPPPLAASEHRLQMLRLAIAGNPRFCLDATECESEEASYTVHTLTRLRQLHGASRSLVLLLGADAFSTLHSWHRWEELLALTNIAVATRPGHPLDVAGLAPAVAALWQGSLPGEPQTVAKSPFGRVFSFAITPLDIAATPIRLALAAGQSPRYLLPDPVLDYIGSHHLYS